MKTCLIVDDSDVVRRVLGLMLKAIEFEVVEAASADEALAICDRGLANLVLLDWQMPGLSSYDFLKAFRSRPGGDAAHIIYCTTQNDTLVLARHMTAGASDYLLKPFDRGDLVARLTACGILDSESGARVMRGLKRAYG